MTIFHKCITLESIMFLYDKKQVISQIPNVYFSVQNFHCLFQRNIFFTLTHT